MFAGGWSGQQWRSTEEQVLKCKSWNARTYLAPALQRKRDNYSQNLRVTGSSYPVFLHTFPNFFCHCLQLNWTSTLLWGPCLHPFLCQYTKRLPLSSNRNQKWAWLKGLQKWIWLPVTMQGIRASLAIVSLPSITLVGIVRLLRPLAKVLHLFNMLRRHYTFKHNCIRTVCAPLFLRQSLPDANVPSL